MGSAKAEAYFERSLAISREQQADLRKIVQDRGIDRVLAENRLVLTEAQAPQSPPDIHEGVLIPRWRAIIG
jgi:hypothetical protein